MVKIICAGFSKTGTKSLAKALKILGYNEVFDIGEALEYSFKDWEQIFNGNSEDVQNVLEKNYPENVEVVVDVPHFIFIEDFIRKWPDAKVILMLRDEKDAFRSYKKMLDDVKMKYSSLYGIVEYISPTSKKISSFFKNINRFTWGSAELNELMYCRAMRRHNAFVREIIPKKQLLEYNVIEGWKSLCEFLDKNKPLESFPRENIGTDEIKITDKLISQMNIQNRVMIELLLFAIFVIACASGIAMLLYYYVV